MPFDVIDNVTALDAAGWAIVPKVPTAEMIAAGRAEIKPDGLPADDSDVRAMWAALLAAAPKPNNCGGKG